jgi:hypothetical protein
LKRIRVPIERSRSQVLEYDVEPGQGLRFDAHAGAREIKAVPRRPVHPMLHLRAYDVRQEGRRRSYRIYTAYD